MPTIKLTEREAQALYGVLDNVMRRRGIDKMTYFQISDVKKKVALSMKRTKNGGLEVWLR